MKTIVDAFEKDVKQSLSPDIIIHSNQLDISVSTAYRYIHFHHMGAIINVDLKRQVKYKTRSSSKHVVIPINYDWLEGRRYEDYIERIENEDVSNMVNNYPRRSLNYNSPIDIATLSLNEKVLSLNKLKHLNIKQVKLTPITH